MDKIIFLDVDGVLNSQATLNVDESLEDSLILRLKKIIDATGAKLILTSSWRELWTAVKKLMDKLDKYDMHLSGMTGHGVSKEFVAKKGFTPTKRYVYVDYNYETGLKEEAVYDRGAEIAWWLDKHDSIESFVILDDDEYDIKIYYPDNLVNTNYKTGLSDEDVEKAIKILNK